MRIVSRHPSLFVMAGILVCLAACGDKKHKDYAETQPPSSSGKVPSGWDLRSDWSGSPLKARNLVP